MVPWPWKKGDDAASYEKTLSNLAGKINKTSSKNERLRQQARRLNLVWILYAGFAYILAALILTLVTGVKSWGAVEYTAIAGGPLLIYGVRRGLSAIYAYRISSTQSSLDGLYKDRDVTIDKLKAATKYDSTQQLLKKYGSPRPSPAKDEGSSSKSKSKSRTASGNATQQRRTNLPPPPTANIPQSPPGFDPRSHSPPNTSGQAPSPHTYSPRAHSPSAEFAPNAFSSDPSHMASYEPAQTEHHWYDRFMDAVLGEDETLARNRIALICSSCRVVNGQAPPGKTRLEDVGRWRCGQCGAWNGVEDESKSIVESITGQGSEGGASRRAENVAVKTERDRDDAGAGPSPVTSVSVGHGDLTPEESEEEELSGAESEELPPARSTRSRKKRG